MGLGNFLKKLTVSPFKAAGQAMHGQVGRSLRTAATGGGTAPLARYAPGMGGRGRAQAGPGNAALVQALGQQLAAPVQGGGAPVADQGALAGMQNMFGGMRPAQLPQQLPQQQQPQPQPQQAPAPAAPLMSYDEAKAQFGAARAQQMQQAGQVGG